MGLMIVKDIIPETFRRDGEINDLKQFLAEMDLRFTRSDITCIRTPINLMCTLPQSNGMSM